MGKKLYVGNLSYEVTNASLEELFVPFGTVRSAQVIQDRDTGRSKGFGFVEMADDNAALAAIEGLNEKEHNGRPLAVNEARPPKIARVAAVAEGAAGAVAADAADTADIRPRRVQVFARGRLIRPTMGHHSRGWGVRSTNPGWRRFQENHAWLRSTATTTSATGVRCVHRTPRRRLRRA